MIVGISDADGITKLVFTSSSPPYARRGALVSLKDEASAFYLFRK